jgi:L-serine deaminase
VTFFIDYSIGRAFPGADKSYVVAMGVRGRQRKEVKIIVIEHTLGLRC